MIFDLHLLEPAREGRRISPPAFEIGEDQSVLGIHMVDKALPHCIILGSSGRLGLPHCGLALHLYDFRSQPLKLFARARGGRQDPRCVMLRDRTQPFELAPYIHPPRRRLRGYFVEEKQPILQNA